MSILGTKNWKIRFLTEKSIFRPQNGPKISRGCYKSIFLTQKRRILAKNVVSHQFWGEKSRKKSIFGRKIDFSSFSTQKYVRMAQNGLKIVSTAYMDPLGGVGTHAHWRIPPSHVFTVEAQSMNTIPCYNLGFKNSNLKQGLGFVNFC